jgi:hypothetical protein
VFDCEAPCSWALLSGAGFVGAILAPERAAADVAALGVTPATAVAEVMAQNMAAISNAVTLIPLCLLLNRNLY